MKRLIALLTIMFTLGALWFTGAALADPAPAAEQVLHYETVPPDTLDPAKATSMPEQELIVNLFEGLTRLGPGDKPVPGAAESWTISPDGLVYTFTLRESKWSNGDPVTAQDFEYAWKRVLDPKTHSEYVFQLYYLLNGVEYNNSEIFNDDEVGVKALDDRTLQVTLEEPAPYFLALTSFPTLMPVHRKTVETRPLTWFFQPETLISNGPFRLTKKTDAQLELSRNPLYWDAAHTVLERVEIALEEDESQAAPQFSDGKLDILSYPENDHKKWRSHPGYKSELTFGTYYLYVNCQKAPLTDKRVRQALFLGINREKIAAEIIPTASPAYAFVPGGTPDLAPDTNFRTAGGNFLTTGDRSQDLAKARDLLAEAGYPGGKGLAVELLYNENAYHERIAKAIQDSWQKELGIKVKLVAKPWREALARLDAGDYELGRSGWIADYAHPLSFLKILAGGGGNNSSGWQNQAYDGLLAKAKAAQDPAASLAAMHEAEAILMDEMPVIPIYFYIHPVVYQPWVKGVRCSAMGYFDFKSAWIEAH